MHIPAKYFHDRSILLLISLNVFLALLASLLILLRLDSGDSSSYIVQFRSNLGLSGYESGESSYFLAFIIFFVLMLATHIILSMKIYTKHRRYSVAILFLATIIVVFGLVVSNALLALR